MFKRLFTVNIAADSLETNPTFALFVFYISFHFRCLPDPICIVLLMPPPRNNNDAGVPDVSN